MILQGNLLSLLPPQLPMLVGKKLKILRLERNYFVRPIEENRKKANKRWWIISAPTVRQLFLIGFLWAQFRVLHLLQPRRRRPEREAFCRAAQRAGEEAASHPPSPGLIWFCTFFACSVWQHFQYPPPLLSSSTKTPFSALTSLSLLRLIILTGQCKELPLKLAHFWRDAGEFLNWQIVPFLLTNSVSSKYSFIRIFRFGDWNEPSLFVFANIENDSWRGNQMRNLLVSRLVVDQVVKHLEEEKGYEGCLFEQFGIPNHSGVSRTIRDFPEPFGLSPNHSGFSEWFGSVRNFHLTEGSNFRIFKWDQRPTVDNKIFLINRNWQIFKFRWFLESTSVNALRACLVGNFTGDSFICYENIFLALEHRWTSEQITTKLFYTFLLYFTNNKYRKNFESFEDKNLHFLFQWFGKSRIIRDPELFEVSTLFFRRSSNWIFELWAGLGCLYEENFLENDVTNDVIKYQKPKTLSRFLKAFPMDISSVLWIKWKLRRNWRSILDDI